MDIDFRVCRRPSITVNHFLGSLALAFGFLSPGLAAGQTARAPEKISDELLFVRSGVTYDAWVNADHCITSRRGEIRLYLNHRSAHGLRERDRTMLHVREALFQMQQWGNAACLKGDGKAGEPYRMPIKVRSWFGGTEVAKASMTVTVDYQRRFENVEVHAVGPAPEQSERGEQYERLAQLHREQLRSLFHREPVKTGADAASQLKLVDALERGAGPFERAHLVYLRGVIKGRQVAWAPRKNHLIDPRRGKFSRDYEGPEAEALYAEALAMGHSGAALALAWSVNLPDTLLDFARNMNHGITAVPGATADLFKEYGWLMQAGLEHRHGWFVSAEQRIKNEGGDISAGILQVSSSATPSQYAIQNAINAALADRANTRSALFSTTTGFPRNLTWRCDGSWCEVVGGLLRVRYSTLGPHSCDKAVNKSTECTFPIRFILRATGFMNQGNHPGEAILNNVARLQTQSLRGRATFVRQQGLWQLAPGEVVQVIR